MKHGTPLLQICVGCWSRGEHTAFTPQYKRHYFCNTTCFETFLDGCGLRQERCRLLPDKRAIGHAIQNARRRMRKAWNNESRERNLAALADPRRCA